MLRKVFDPKREVVAGTWRELNSKQLHGFHHTRNIIGMIKLKKKMRWSEHVANMWMKMINYRVLVGKPEGWSRLGNLLVDRRIILKTDSQEWRRGVVDLNNLSQNEKKWSAFVKMTIKIQVTSNERNFPIRFTHINF